jgi:hypothetical protein
MEYRDHRAIKVLTAIKVPMEYKGHRAIKVLTEM